MKFIFCTFRMETVRQGRRQKDTWRVTMSRKKAWSACPHPQQAALKGLPIYRQDSGAGSCDLTSSVQSLSCVSLRNSVDCSTPGFPVHHQLMKPAQTQVHWVGDAIQPSHLLSSPSPPAFNLSQHQDLFQWVSSSHQVAKVLEFQLQHQFFQWTLRTDLL